MGIAQQNPDMLGIAHPIDTSNAHKSDSKKIKAEELRLNPSALILSALEMRAVGVSDTEKV